MKIGCFKILLLGVLFLGLEVYGQDRWVYHFRNTTFSIPPKTCPENTANNQSQPTLSVKIIPVLQTHWSKRKLSYFRHFFSWLMFLKVILVASNFPLFLKTLKMFNYSKNHIATSDFRISRGVRKVKKWS